MLRLIILMVAFSFISQIVEGKAKKNDVGCDTEWTGCKVKNGRCVCHSRMACKNPFEYNTEEQCKQDLFYDVCAENPCKHGGQCMQLNNKQYRCMCEGSHYYCKHCQKKCPFDLSRLSDAEQIEAEDCFYF
ncbi:uncharacterized protein [Antedon mediterranea]|uniref:uncharacterized protein n=1 Tax=Antedon mediterranea TaxID=105859 RepID=UPI003AF4BD3B